MREFFGEGGVGVPGGGGGGEMAELAAEAGQAVIRGCEEADEVGGWCREFGGHGEEWFVVLLNCC